MNENLSRIQHGKHHDPFDWLGWHPLPGGQWALRTFMPAAEAVEVVGHGEMTRLEGTDCFEIELPSPTDPAAHPPLRWQDKQSGDWHDAICPYTFAPQLGELDLYLLQQGRHHHAWKILGSHPTQVEGVDGVQFAVWAPAVQRVSVIGDFNGWDGRRHCMRSRGSSGVWEIFIPGLQPGLAYKYEILNRRDQIVRKTDPYAQQMFMRPETTSCIPADAPYVWEDDAWIDARSRFDWQHQPVSVYELHPGSWRRHPDGGFYNWTELADALIPYITDLNYTHIELLPVAEHPLDESWGYQVSGYYAPTARYGSADDFRLFVDACHQAGIGVLLDWVPAHFPKDDFALARFTGEPLYEHADPRRGEHQDWGTLIFDFGRNEVKNFLLSNALYWIEEFHIDGLRVDAVASMLYLDYSRKAGEWLPNQYGGRENIEAIAFLREMNTVVHGYFPGVLTIAEESTAWPAVSRPVEIGGLGFSMKWNMGWMNDNLSYIQHNPVHRKYHHNLLTFSQVYAYSENFVLPLSHDEVVHMKHSMLDKMPGDYWQAFANLRLFYAWQYAHPGKKLLFMGCEFGQWSEWNVGRELDWALVSFPAHDSIRHLLRDLNQLYRQQPALYQYDFDWRGFQWIDCHDSDQSVLSLIRQGDRPEDSILVLLNFTPIPRHQYRIGVPASGHYRELLNTDSEYYGGSNCGNEGEIPVQAHPWMGFEHSIEVTLPPLAALFLQAR
ncbi:1,4-alpha-glucan branching protein GlgB [Candidatus Thiothrix sp. Deng01]|uniref:1,4-alpha-glucan branching enzyme GlgB n=1 Tax=Candidatus Thiothrix phosphatis TaxID=3112415 RepID=A0ABU6D0F0_9GAMM|nr:1,4-alpha-glucan branching protein GlgB [Candidatus Thiothrix sp. Deng01]MEB4592544.1 1,4-alpha-glucan branching protein GlgB [Candidatus Thiothrix sp. Deng01]